MVKRRRGEIYPAHRAALLESMRSLRDIVCRIHAATEMQRAIDRFAGVLTGDPENFWAKPHSLAQGPK